MQHTILQNTLQYTYCLCSITTPTQTPSGAILHGVHPGKQETGSLLGQRAQSGMDDGLMWELCNKPSSVCITSHVQLCFQRIESCFKCKQKQNKTCVSLSLLPSPWQHVIQKSWKHALIFVCHFTSTFHFVLSNYYCNTPQLVSVAKTISMAAQLFTLKQEVALHSARVPMLNLPGNSKVSWTPSLFPCHTDSTTCWRQEVHLCDSQEMWQPRQCALVSGSWPGRCTQVWKQKSSYWSTRNMTDKHRHLKAWCTHYRLTVGQHGVIWCPSSFVFNVWIPVFFSCVETDYFCKKLHTQVWTSGQNQWSVSIQ